MGCRRMLGAHAAPDQRTACARRRVAHCPPWIVPPDAHSVIRHEAINTWIDATPRKPSSSTAYAYPRAGGCARNPQQADAKPQLLGCD